MKPEEHICFLSELLQTIQQLQVLVQDYCRELTGDDEKPVWKIDSNDCEKTPF